VLSKESDDKQQPITSDEAETLSFTSDEKSEIEEISPISDNVKRITEALDALESDIIQQEDITPYQQQSQTSKTVEGLIDELDVIESDLRLTTLNDDIRHTLEDHTAVFSSKDELVDEDLLPKTIEQEHFHDISKDETLSNTELDSRYSTLLDHIDSLEKTLLEFQPSPSSINETVTTTTTTDIKKDKEDATHTEQQISTLEDGKPAESDVNINDLAKTMEGILATPVRTIINPYEKIAHEEHITHSGLETALEQILATTHYPSKYTKLIPPIDTITSTDELKDQHEEIQTEQSKDISTTHYSSKYTKLISPIDTITSTDELKDQHEEIQTEQSEDISTTADQKTISNDEVITPVEEKDSANILDKATSIVTDIISSITHVLPTTTTEDTTVSTKEDITSEVPTTEVDETTTTKSIITSEKESISPFVTEDETKVIESDASEQHSTTGLVEIMKTSLPSSLQSIISDSISTEESTVPVEEDHKTISTTKIETTDEIRSKEDETT
ncbi:unnamed protein product, partial [Adineta steineri]